jgi:hypothetical protein
MELDVATVLLQWSTGGLAFCWVTTRRREVGLGYGWLLRGTFVALAVAGIVAGRAAGDGTGGLVRDLAGAAMAAAAAGALTVSVARRRAGVSGQLAVRAARQERVETMLRQRNDDHRGVESTTPEFPPALDLLAPALGLVALVAAAAVVGGPYPLSAARLVIGALFLGAVTDAMLLGHWYLVQPGLPRRLLNEIVAAVAWVWPIEVIALLLPTGMFSVWSGTVDDGWGGMLGWIWGACAVTTIALVFVTRAALREREYSAVMAATGLLYLAILTAFGTDLVARAVLDG